MARWLNSRLPAHCGVLASPALRAQQTAAALGREFQTVPELGADATATGVLDAAGWPDRAGVVVIVGHQPILGRVAARVLAGAEVDWSIKKGGLWWIEGRVRGGREATVLRAAIAPDLL